MKVHELKTWPDMFDLVWRDLKRFEIRNDDRGFNAGDILHLREWSPDSGEYSGRELRAKVTCVIREWLLPPLCAMGITVFDISEDGAVAVGA